MHFRLALGGVVVKEPVEVRHVQGEGDLVAIASFLVDMMSSFVLDRPRKSDELVSSHRSMFLQLFEAGGDPRVNARTCWHVIGGMRTLGGRHGLCGFSPDSSLSHLHHLGMYISLAMKSFERLVYLETVLLSILCRWNPACHAP